MKKKRVSPRAAMLEAAAKAFETSFGAPLERGGSLWRALVAAIDEALNVSEPEDDPVGKGDGREVPV